MIGRTLDSFYPDVEEGVREDVVLTAKDLSGSRVDSVSLKMHRGELVGVAGLRGSGKSELGRLLFGAQRRTGGEVLLHGKPLELRDPTDAIRHGIAMVPANRHREGTHLTLSVADNITLTDLGELRAFGRVRRRRLRSITAPLLERYDVRPRRADRPMSTLSGGNQQKAVLAKWMHRNPAVLILDEPAQGIDIGAKTQVYTLLEEAAREGMAVLVISEEFEDLAQLCHRVLVMRRGTLVADLSGDKKTRDTITDIVYQEKDAA